MLAASLQHKPRIPTPRTPADDDPQDRNAPWRSPQHADFDLSKPRPDYDTPPHDEPYMQGDHLIMPRQIRLSSGTDYITGNAALNLVDPSCPPSGDWHALGWWGAYDAKRPWVNNAFMSADQGWHSTAAILGDARLFDCRESLAARPHPASKRSTPVWCAHHDRAIADIAWDFLNACYPLGYIQSHHAPCIAEWLWEDFQLAHLQAHLERLTPHVPKPALPGWNLWRSELTLDAHWQTFDSPAESLGLLG